MKKFRINLIALTLAIVMVFSSCASTTNSTIHIKKEVEKITLPDDNSTIDKTTEEALSEQEKFDDYLDELFYETMDSSVLSVYSVLSYPEEFGITEYNYYIGEFDEESFNEDIKDSEESLKELQDINCELLTDDQQLIYDMLAIDLAESVESGDYYWFNEYLSPLYGLASSMPSYMSQFSIHNKIDADNYIEIIKLLPKYYEDMMIYEAQKADKGMGLSDRELDEAIDKCNEFIADVDNHFMITTFNDRIDMLSELSDSEKTSYKTTNENLIKTQLIPQYQKMISELTALKGKCKNQGGLCNFENGKNYYEYLVRSKTGSSRSIKQLKKLIQGYLDNDIERFIELYRQDSSLFDSIEKYPIKTDDPDEILEYLLGEIKEDFPEGYSQNYTINEVPKAIEKYESPAYYYIPNIDDTLTNNIYINKHSDYDNLDLFATLAHEGFPGHMYQSTYFYNSNPNKIRALLSYPGYMEGWGLYSEFYSYKLSGVSETQAEFDTITARISYELYCLIDIGINYEGWDISDVEDFLTKSGYDSSVAESIYYTLIEDPASYMPYLVGYLEILELRNEAEDTLGNSYSAKSFHKFLLDIGPAQFDVIHDRFEIWLENSKNYS